MEPIEEIVRQIEGSGQARVSVIRASATELHEYIAEVEDRLGYREGKLRVTSFLGGMLLFVPEREQ